MIRHLPPKHIMPEVNFYGVQENLFHEALHQQLSALIIQQDVLKEAPSTAPAVHIPWRGVDWPIDRVMHAAWVYFGLQELRLARLKRQGDSPEFIKALKAATENGVTVLTYLIDYLIKYSYLFTPIGQAAIRRLKVTVK